MRREIERVYNRFLHSNLDRYKCLKNGIKKIKYGLKKSGFWSRLLKRSKPDREESACIRQDGEEGCPHCPTARIPVDLRHDQLGPSPNFHEYRLSSKHETMATEIPYIPIQSIIRRSPRQWLPEIHTEVVDLGIDWERWAHVRDHIIPPQPGPPPQGPLPPPPKRYLPLRPQKSIRRVPGRDLRKASEESARISECRERGERVSERRAPQVDGGSDLITPLPSPTLASPPQRKAPPPWIKKIDTGIASTTFPSIPSPTASEASLCITQSQEEPDNFQTSPSPVSPVTGGEPSIPLRQAQRVMGKHQLVRSQRGEIGTISPLLDERIDDIVRMWNAACSKPMGQKPDLPPR